MHDPREKILSPIGVRPPLMGNGSSAPGPDDRYAMEPERGEEYIAPFS